MTSPARLEELKADVRYRRERRDLYRAKMHGPRPTSPGLLRELERACALSESRLRRAELPRDLADLQDRDVSRVDAN
jgi:hypothetical protein